MERFVEIFDILTSIQTLLSVNCEYLLGITFIKKYKNVLITNVSLLLLFDFEVCLGTFLMNDYLAEWQFVRSARSQNVGNLVKNTETIKRKHPNAYDVNLSTLCAFLYDFYNMCIMIYFIFVTLNGKEKERVLIQQNFVIPPRFVKTCVNCVMYVPFFFNLLSLIYTYTLGYFVCPHSHCHSL